MKVKEKKLDRRVELWALLGPFIMIVTLFILLIKPVQHPLYIPLAALIGIPLCWRWKLPGLGIALGILGGLVAYQMAHEVVYKAAVWDFVLGISVGLAFCVTALSFKEIQETILFLQKESASRLENFLHVDDKIKAIEQKRDADISAHLAKIDLINTQLSERTAKLQTYEQLVNLARDEMLHSTREHERLLQESFDKRHECERIKEKLGDAEKKIEFLNDQLSTKESEAKQTQQDYDAEIRHQAIVHEMNEFIETLGREKQLLETSLKSLQTEIDTLKSVIEQKDLVLLENNSNAIALKERASLHEQELVQYRKKSEEVIEAYTKKENSLANQLQQLEQKCAQSLQDLEQVNQNYKAFSEKTEKTSKEKEALISEIQTLSIESDKLKSELSLKQQTLKDEIHGHQKAKGMYNQLRSQFEEKNQSLELTRKELFLANEVLLKYQRDLDEEQLYGSKENLAPSSLSHLLKLDEEIRGLEQNHLLETNALHEIVQHLFNKETSHTEIKTVQAEVKKAQEQTPEQNPVKTPTPKKPPKKQAPKEKVPLKQEIAAKSEPKPKSSKPTKTTAWANTILSRWSPTDNP